jgi:toxin ParE1/3/4
VNAVRYTRRAEADLDGIAAYTLQKWGLEQALRYISDLQYCCEALSADTSRDRDFPPIPRYSRIKIAKHVVFFRRKDAEVVVVRILHGSMLPELHLTGEPDE